VTLPPAARVVVPVASRVAWPDRRADAEQVRGAPPGTPVVLADRRLGSRGRLRRHADRLGVSIEAEYVLLPTWEHPVFVSDDGSESLRWLVRTLGTVPPHVRRGRLALEAGLRLWLALASAGAPGERLAAGLLTAVAPARIVVGRRR